MPSGDPEYLELENRRPTSENEDNTFIGYVSHSSSVWPEDMIVVDSEFYRRLSGNQYAEVDQTAAPPGEYHYIPMGDISNNIRTRVPNLGTMDSRVSRQRTPTVTATNRPIFTPPITQVRRNIHSFLN